MCLALYFDLRALINAFGYNCYTLKCIYLEEWGESSDQEGIKKRQQDK